MMPQDVEWPRQLFGLSLLVLNKGATTKRLLRGLLDGPGPRSVCRAHPADFTTANKIQGPRLLNSTLVRCASPEGDAQKKSPPQRLRQAASPSREISRHVAYAS